MKLQTIHEKLSTPRILSRSGGTDYKVCIKCKQDTMPFCFNICIECGTHQGGSHFVKDPKVFARNYRLQIALDQLEAQRIRFNE